MTALRAVESRVAVRDHQRALLQLAACGVLWSTAGLLIKLVDWNVLALWSARCAITAAVLWAVRRPSFARISREEWRAAFALAATTGLFILANKLTTAANAILIQYSAPIWVALLGAWLLGERASRLDWLTIFAVLGGIALFFCNQLTFDHAVGNLVALIAGVATAIFTISIRKVAIAVNTGGTTGAGPTPAAPSDPLRPIFLGQLIGAVLGAPAMLMSPPPGLTGWGSLVVLGIFQQAVPYLLYARAIRRSSALEAILVPVIEPILSPVWVAIAFGELPSSWALLGGAIVVGAVTVRAVLGQLPRAARS